MILNTHKKKVSYTNLLRLKKIIVHLLFSQELYLVNSDIVILAHKQDIEINKCLIKSIKNQKTYSVTIYTELINYIIRNINNSDIIAFMYVFL
jgi:CRISPR/Cas system-associated exonuclease Cas4 (RecB family)